MAILLRAGLKGEVLSSRNSNGTARLAPLQEGSSHARLDER